MSRSYTELRELESFEERFEYLSLRGVVGHATFGFDRWINQQFYTSREWRRLRQHIIARDNGCDLGIDGFEIHSRLIVHHMNPMSQDDIVHGSRHALDPEFLISTTHNTHNAIHYGNSDLLNSGPIERKPGDTQLWNRR